MIHPKSKSKGRETGESGAVGEKGDLGRRVELRSVAPRPGLPAAQRRRREGGGWESEGIGRGSRDLRRRRGGLDPEERGGEAGVGGARGAEWGGAAL